MSRKPPVVLGNVERPSRASEPYRLGAILVEAMARGDLISDTVALLALAEEIGDEVRRTEDC